ncbi:MAG: TerB N-terminal domain-containing protein [Synergistaceae bacterium]|nr:TerB N-terminal domain-containing protein [Synergistaceae bacterium]
MLYLVIGLFVAAAVGALLNQRRSKKGPAGGAPAGQASSAVTTPAAGTAPASGAVPTAGANAVSVQGPTQPDSGGLATIQEEIAPLSPTLAAKPLTSPNAVASATYSSAAPASAGDDSPYSYGTSEEPKKKKPSANLLRWCGRSGSLQVGDVVLLSPVAYWSNGQSSIQEPSCIDITLPIEYPKEGDTLPADGAASYAEMTPIQRGVYLTWLAGGRIQPPLHLCYPSLWLYGLERRVIADRLDLGLCISEAFRLLPLMRWEAMLSNLIRFITWLAIKIWLPEDELLNFCKKLPTVPEELLGMLLGSYANSKLPLPSAVAFTLMRASARLRTLALGENAQEMPHSNEAVQQFTPVYKDACAGGLVLEKPKSSLSLSYTPTNPSLVGEKSGKKDPGGVVELPNFFEDLSVFEPLIAVWKDFVPTLTPPKPETAAEELEDRPDFEAFIRVLRPEGSEAPLIATLANLGELLRLDTKEQEKPKGRDRKSMVELAQVEGWQIVPNLGTSGRDYRWEDKVLFLPLEPGTLLSQEYAAASFLLEFLCSLTEAREQRVFELLRQRMNEYFPALTMEDNVRLEEQSKLNLPAPYPPEYYGDILQISMSQDGDRAVLRNFLLDFLSFLPEMQAQMDTLKEKTSVALGIAQETEPLPASASSPAAENPPSGQEGEAAPTREPAELGKEALDLLSPLFR